ncbi:MAG: T9SS type A sorting domain-containing protein [Bacteroidota bacterium]
MKSILVIILSLLFLSGQTSLSQSIFFNNRYDFYNISEAAWDVLEIESDYLVVGGARDSLFDLHIAIMILDSAGNEIWKKSYGQTGFDYYPGYSGSFIKTTDNGYALGGAIVNSFGNNDVLLVRFNSELDTLWTKTFGDTMNFDAGYQCKQTLDDGFIIVGVTGDIKLDILLIKTDSLGNVEWEQTYGGANTEYSRTIDVAFDGGFIIGGNTWSYGAGSKDTYVIKTDSLGNLQWQRTFGNVYEDCSARGIATSDSGYIFCGCKTEYMQTGYPVSRAYIVKLDSAGNTEWEKTYGPLKIGADFWMIRELDDGGFITAGVTGDSLDWFEGSLLKINSQGDSIWFRTYEKVYGPTSNNYFRDVQPTSDGGYIMAGFITPQSPDTGTQDMWVIKVDSLGNNLSLIITTNNVSCNGDSNGTVDLNVLGGVPPYTYYWSNGDTTEDISELTSGFYTVNILDNNGCTITDSIAITEPLAINISFIVDTATQSNNDGAIDITVSGGTLPYFYSWSNGDSTEDISSIPAGYYTVIVTDSMECIDSLAVEVPEFTSIKKHSITNDQLKFYPTPFTDKITLQFNRTGKKDIKIRIYNVLGELVYKETIPESRNTINLSDLPGGIYLLQLQGEQIIRKKIIKL